MNQLEKIISQDPGGVLSLTGGGGKTSLMFHLAHQLAATGKKVLTTTTTKIFVPTADQSQVVLIDPEPEAILAQAASRPVEERHLTAAARHIAEGDKLKGFEPEAIRTFEKSGLFDWILVEADGSARRPLKAPAEHEPVIPPNTTILVAVAGLEVIGQPLCEALVFRSKLAARCMDLSEGATITEAALAHLFAHPLGAFKGAPPVARRLIFLNKADNRQRLNMAAQVAEVLRQNSPPIAEALIAGQALDTVRIHSIHNLGDKP